MRCPLGLADTVPPAARKALLHAADQLMDGHGEVFGIDRHDYVDPDWFLDAASGVRAPQEAYAFDIPHRDQAVVGNIKNVWEPSRHHHLTVLAAAYWLSGDERYAERCAAHLRSWWKANPFLSGVHWTSGIELGIRLVSWTWVRRLLDGWSGAVDLFERQPGRAAPARTTTRSTWRRCTRRARRPTTTWWPRPPACSWPPPRSRGSTRARRWRTTASSCSTREVDLQTFPSGINRELASEYHGLTLELALVGIAELDLAGRAVPAPLWDATVRMVDALAGLVDVEPAHGPPGRRRRRPRARRRRPRRQPVGLDPRHRRRGARRPAVVAVAARCRRAHHHAGRRAATARRAPTGPRCGPRASATPASCCMRTARGTRPEIWVRADDGPLGFLSIAAHGHADALALEVRHEGVDVIADPGTFCYHGDPEWRAWFRGTRSHATLELDGVDQAVSGGPFLWTRHVPTRRTELSDLGDVVVWTAEHDGYRRLDDPATHRRTVRFSRSARALEVTDVVAVGRGPPGAPVVAARPAGRGGARRRRGPSVVARRLGPAAARPDAVVDVHRGDADPVEGWYSPGFGRKVPASILVGTGHAGRGGALRCTLVF